MKRIERHRSSRCFLTLSLLPTLKVQGEHHMCVKQRESCSYMKKYYYTVGIFSNERKSHKKECPLCAAFFFFTYTGEDRVCVAHPFDMREAVTSHMYTYTHKGGGMTVRMFQKHDELSHVGRRFWQRETRSSSYTFYVLKSPTFFGTLPSTNAKRIYI